MGTHEPVAHGALDHAELAALGIRAEQLLDFSSNINPFGKCALLWWRCHCDFGKLPDGMQRSWREAGAFKRSVNSRSAALLPARRGDAESIAGRGFTDVRPIADALDWNGLRVNRVDGRQGSGAVGRMMGNVSGFVFSAPGEPTLYWAGDTVLCPEMSATSAHFRPALS